MKKINNPKFRNNNNVYSLNYKFDSVCAAGKFSGTALDLIKRYNELAKEAQGNGNYVEMEVFRQYAEHYRKIVTEINERRNQNREQDAATADSSEDNRAAENNPENNSAVNNNLVETESAEPAPAQPTTEISSEDTTKTTKTVRRRSFKIVDFSQDDTVKKEATTEAAPKPRRRILKSKTAESSGAASNE